MAKQNILVGASANDKAGDTLRNAFVKVNANFTELYTLTGGTSTALTELAQDYAAPLFNHASHTNITVTYDDANNKILLTGVASAVWPVANTAGANGPTRIAIGNSAGDIAQGNATVAVGSYAGNDTQGGAAVAIGTYAGTTTQRNDAIAIGYLTGNDVQGTGAVSIGRQAGQTNQGAYSIAIGKLAGQTNQAANTIILNALNAPLNGVSAQTNSFYVNPIRTDATPGNILFYNTTTKEITYGAAGSVSSLVNGAKTVSLGTDSILTLPAPLAQLINASQLATDTAKIYRATNSTDLAAIATAWDNWYSSELMFRELVYQDSVTNPNRPWANKPSWEAYPIITAYMPTGSQLPIPSNLPPTAKAAQDNYLAYKQLVSSIDIVNGNKTISFNNAGLLSLPGKLEFKDTANAKIILKTIDQFGYVVEDPTQDKTWTFNANGSLTFPNNTTQTTAWTGSVSSLVNGANTVSLDNGGLDLTFTSGEKIKTIFGGGIELYRSGDNTIGIYTSGAEIKTFATGGAKHTWTFGTNGTTTFPSNSIKNSLDNSTAITTQRTLTANNSYTNVTDFSTDVDLGGGLGVIAGWYQRNASQIEFALFGDFTFQLYLTGLALGRTVIVTYNTASGTATLTGTVTQAFTQQGQSDPNNPSWGRVSGRIDATLPVGQLGIASINFPVYSTSTNNWTFGANGNTTFPTGLVLGAPRGSGTVNFTSAIDKEFQIETGTASYSKLWRFETNGNTTLPTGLTFRKNGTPYSTITADLDKVLQIETQTSGGVKQWSLGTNGGLTLPSGGVISEGGGLTGAIKLTPAGGANAYQALLIYPTAGGDGDHVHLTAGGGTTELYLGNDNHYVKLVNGGNVEVRAYQPTSPYATAVWGFGTDGAVSATKPLIINVPNGVPSSVGAIGATTGSWELNPRSNLATTGGSGSGLTVNVTETGGYASAIAIATAGTGYLDGELITVTSGSSSASFIIAVTGNRSWTFGTDGKLTAPGNLQVNGGKIILNTGGNAYVESVDYGVNSANSAVNIFGGPYQKIKLRAGFGTEATWQFGTDGSFKLPNNSELRPSTAAYDSALASWEYIRTDQIQYAITNSLATSAGWPMVDWHPTGLTAQGYIDFLLNAWTVQNTLGGTLIVYPAMSNSFYQQMRTILINIRDNYSLTSSGVSISSGYAKSWNFNEDGKLTFPDGTSQNGAGVQSIHGSLTTANAGGYTVTRNGLTVSIVWDNTSGVAGIIKIAFDSNTMVTERTVTLRTSSQVNSSYIGTNTALTANQVYTIATLTNLGDFSTTHIITGSYNIYRITAVLQQADAPGGNPVAAGYATIEQLR